MIWFEIARTLVIGGMVKCYKINFHDTFSSDRSRFGLARFHVKNYIISNLHISVFFLLYSTQSNRKPSKQQQQITNHVPFGKWYRTKWFCIRAQIHNIKNIYTHAHSVVHYRNGWNCEWKEPWKLVFEKPVDSIASKMECHQKKERNEKKWNSEINNTRSPIHTGFCVCVSVCNSKLVDCAVRWRFCDVCYLL